MLSQIKVKVKKLEKFEELWRSSGIATKHKASIWEDKAKGGAGRLTQRIVCASSSATSRPPVRRAAR